MCEVKAVSAAHPHKKKTFNYKTLYTSSHVFLRNHAAKHWLDPPYSGPHPVIESIDDRVLKIEVNGRQVNVNEKNLKPAHLLTDETDSSNDDQAMNVKTENTSGTYHSYAQQPAIGPLTNPPQHQLHRENKNNR